MKGKFVLCSMFMAFVLASLPAYAEANPTINQGGICESQLDSLTNSYLCAPIATLIDQTYLSIYGQNLDNLDYVMFNSLETGMQYLPINYDSKTQINVCLYLAETNITNATLTVVTSHGSASVSSINVTTWQPAYGMTKCT